MAPENSDTARENSDQALFDQIADAYARKDIVKSTSLARGAIVRRAMKPVIAARQGRVGTLVDVGCGVGAQARYLGGSFERYIGIDYSKELLAAGARMFEGRDDIELLNANIKDPSLPENIADVVLVVTALHHMVDLADVMQALERLARPGADFVAIEPQRGNPLIQGMRYLRMKLDPHYSEDQHFFSKPELQDILEHVPMGEKRVEFQGFLTPPFGQAGVKPQAVFLPLSHIACALEPLAEALCIGPLGALSWNAVCYGKFLKTG